MIFLYVFLALMAVGVISIWISLIVVTADQQSVQIKGLPSAFDGLRLLHVSDLHKTRRGKHNAKLAQMIMKANPDYVLAAGDMADKHKPGGSAFLELLQHLDGKIPVIMSIGNHESVFESKDKDRYCKFLAQVKDAGVQVLDNTKVMIERKGQFIAIVGLTLPLQCYYRHKKPLPLTDYLGHCPKEMPVILLAHHPRFFPQYARWGASLVLSGHIHGGMIRLPFVGGLLSPDREFFPKYDAGIFTEKDCTMHVSRGIGQSGPWRLFSFGQLTSIVLTKKNSGGDTVEPSAKFG